VDADQPLKVLFRLRARDLLGLTGDVGARLLSARVLELPASKRSVDTVLRLRRGPSVYLRHVEFEMRHRRGVELRLFEYAARLGAQFRLPVVTTVVFLRPPAPRELAYREVIGSNVVHERRFGVVRLWEQAADELLAMGPGPAALVGLTHEAGPRHVRAAVRMIDRTTSAPERNDLLYVLQALCAERYTDRKLREMIPRGAVMASGMFAKEFRQARAEGRAEGRAEVLAEGRSQLRTACLDIVKYFHPKALVHVAPAIEACESLPTLKRWTVAAARLSSPEFLRLVGRAKDRTARTVAERRAPRPARRSAARRRRRKQTRVS